MKRRSVEEVHRWLDEFMGTEKYWMRHRKVRHHQAGIKKVIEIFGKEAGEAARQHIISDLKEEGWKETDPFPKDQEDYVFPIFFHFRAVPCLLVLNPPGG